MAELEQGRSLPAEKHRVVPAIAHLDLPLEGVVRAPLSELQGWLATDGAPVFHRLTLVNAHGNIAIPLTIVDRPDVRAVHHGRASTGFSGSIGLREAATGPWRVRYETAGGTSEVAVPLRVDLRYADAFYETKRLKLARIRPLLRCPLCHAELSGDAPQLHCVSGHVFRAGPDAYDLLPDDLRGRVGAISAANISAHGYDDILLELIANTEGPVLDVGAGLRLKYREDVINLEIVPYPSTDVVAASEYLPFADATFGLVISVAVLEHVRDPFAAARELERIIRPGGRIFAAVPFLQPYHAYPDHYYNMTAGGLRNLFPGCDVERLDVPASGLPLFALTWILRAWRDALPRGVAAAFDQMRVADLAVDPMSLIDQPFVRELPASVNTELAALNVLVGRKRD